VIPREQNIGNKTRIIKKKKTVECYCCVACVMYLLKLNIVYVGHFGWPMHIEEVRPTGSEQSTHLTHSQIMGESNLDGYYYYYYYYYYCCCCCY
jgi:hypothetical protein